MIFAMFMYALPVVVVLAVFYWKVVRPMMRRAERDRLAIEAGLRRSAVGVAGRLLDATSSDDRSK